MNDNIKVNSNMTNVNTKMNKYIYQTVKKIAELNNDHIPNALNELLYKQLSDDELQKELVQKLKKVLEKKKSDKEQYINVEISRSSSKFLNQALDLHDNLKTKPEFINYLINEFFKENQKLVIHDFTRNLDTYNSFKYDLFSKKQLDKQIENSEILSAKIDKAIWQKVKKTAVFYEVNVNKMFDLIVQKYKNDHKDRLKNKINNIFD